MRAYINTNRGVMHSLFLMIKRGKIMLIVLLFIAIIILFIICMIRSMKYRVLLLSFIVVLVIIVGVILIITINHIDGRLLSYEKYNVNTYIAYYSPEEFEESYGSYFDMNESTINDLFNYPKKYTCYSIKIRLTNTSNKKIYDVNPALAKKYENLWLDKSSLSPITILELEAHETLEHDVHVIIKTENMSDKEIDELIKSVKLKIYASNVNWELDTLLYSTKAISFDD